MRLLRPTAALFCLAMASGGHAQGFSHDFGDGPLPWKTEDFGADPDRFTFAFHGDLTGGERPDIFATAMRQVALLRPDFVIGAGDLIEGGGDHAALMAEWNGFDARAALAGAPVFYVGGNHGLSSAAERAAWAERNSPLFYHFRYQDVLFLVLDSEDMSPGRREEIATARAEAVEIYKTEGPEAFAATPCARSRERSTAAIGAAQARYFVETIAENAAVRHTFVFVHKPVRDAEATPFSGVEEALADRPYTLFNGHVHVYAHRVRNGRDHIQVATTGVEQFPDLGPSEDHVTLVTVSGDGTVDIATLMMQGIRDKTGAITGPAGLCFSVAACGDYE